MINYQAGYIMKDYDAIVVGAGNSGLIAAMELIKKGKRTLIIEQNNYPGGCATSFVRGRFEIEPSLHELCGFGSDDHDGSLVRLFKDFGIQCPWISIKDCFRAIGKYSDGTSFDITLPNGKAKFIEKIEEYVPGSKDKLNLLFSVMEDIHNGLSYISDNRKYSVLHLIKNYPGMLISGSYTVLEVFDALGIPWKAKEILSLYWSYLGVDIEHLNFVHYSSMLYEYIFNPIYIPKYTSHYLSSLILKRYQELGGEIWYCVKGEEFLFKDNKCIGIRTNKGDIYAPLVFPDIKQDIIYGKMIREDLVPIRQKKIFNARKGNYSGILATAYFCLDVDKDELGIKDYSIFFSGNNKKQSNEIFLNDFVIFLCYNVADPEFSPKGTSVVSFTAFADPVFFERLKQEDYYSVKTKMGEYFISLLKDKLSIDISKHIEEVEIATPWTFSRYLNTPMGSVYGHATENWDSVVARTLNMDKDYSIPGLYPIGCDTIKGDGYSSAYLAGKDIVDFALERIKEQ